MAVQDTLGHACSIVGVFCRAVMGQHIQLAMAAVVQQPVLLCKRTVCMCLDANVVCCGCLCKAMVYASPLGI
jgi:hypothetical protein